MDQPRSWNVRSHLGSTWAILPAVAGAAAARAQLLPSRIACGGNAAPRWQAAGNNACEARALLSRVVRARGGFSPAGVDPRCHLPSPACRRAVHMNAGSQLCKGPRPGRREGSDRGPLVAVDGRAPAGTPTAVCYTCTVRVRAKQGRSSLQFCLRLS